MFKGRRLRVFVVDDNSLLRLAIGEALEARGCVVVGEAGDGIEAAAKIEMLMPDVMLLDLRMPSSDGFDLLHAMTSTPWRVPVVVFSADMSPPVRQRLLAYGAKQVVPNGALEIAAAAGPGPSRPRA
jgi:CheY-like chemotaxis protein